MTTTTDFSIIFIQWGDEHLDIPGDGRETDSTLPMSAASAMFWCSVLELMLISEQNSPTRRFDLDAPVFECKSEAGVPLVSISRNRVVTFDGGYEPDASAREFWDAVVAAMPRSLSRDVVVVTPDPNFSRAVGGVG